MTLLLIAVTFSTGVVDAASYVGLHKVFTANMTGNVVFIGLGLAGDDSIPLIRSLLALVGFLSGAVLGGRVLRSVPESYKYPREVFHLFAAVAALELGLAAIFFVLQVDGIALDAVTLALGAAMGTQAAAARRLRVTDVSTVVVTMTLVGLAADSFLGNGARQTPWRRFFAPAVMCAGAAVGYILVLMHLWVALLVAAAVTTVSTGAGYFLSRMELRADRLTELDAEASAAQYSH